MLASTCKFTSCQAAVFGRRFSKLIHPSINRSAHESSHSSATLRSAGWSVSIMPWIVCLLAINVNWQLEIISAVQQVAVAADGRLTHGRSKIHSLKVVALLTRPAPQLSCCWNGEIASLVGKDMTSSAVGCRRTQIRQSTRSECRVSGPSF